jgi:hypothetical protein
MIDLATCSLADFQPYLGVSLTTQVGGAERVLVMDKAEASRSPSQRPAGGFALYFIGEGSVIPQGIVTFTTDKLASFELFIVPVAKEGSKVRYEAVFN